MYGDSSCYHNRACFSGLSASITSSSNVDCNGNKTGTATVSVTGGTTSYNYSWNSTPVQTSATATGLVAGTYIVTVTDAHSCTTTASVTITEPVALTVSGIPTNVSCNGAADGSIAVSHSAGATVVISIAGFDVTGDNGHYGPNDYTLTATAPNG